MKRIIFLILASVLIFGAFMIFFVEDQNIIVNFRNWNSIQIPNIASSWAIQFYEAAKKQVGVVKTYDFSNGYYSSNNWYPPADTGVCSDTIARAWDQMWSGSLRETIDTDMRSNPKLYKNNFDTYINFRRVKNLDVFLSRNAKILTNEIIPGSRENLSQWQTGDIVVFDENPTRKLMHIGIISDIRQDDGVPYMIDNHGYGTNIYMTPLDWPTPIVGHYRYF